MKVSGRCCAAAGTAHIAARSKAEIDDDRNERIVDLRPLEFRANPPMLGRTDSNTDSNYGASAPFWHGSKLGRVLSGSMLLDEGAGAVW